MDADEIRRLPCASTTEVLLAEIAAQLAEGNQLVRAHQQSVQQRHDETKNTMDRLSKAASQLISPFPIDEEPPTGMPS